ARTGGEVDLLTAGETAELTKFVLSETFLPSVLPKLPGRFAIAHLFVLLSQLAIGPKWGTKSSPQTNNLHNYKHLFWPSSLTPRRWRARYEADLWARYATYDKLRDILFGGPAANSRKEPSIDAVPARSEVQSEHSAA